MEREEKQGAVCLKCGWVYTNSRPSAKRRRAHQKHCGATDGGVEGGEEKNASDDVLAKEERGKNSVKAALEDLNRGVEEKKVGSGGEVRDFVPSADNNLEPCVFLHGSANKLESDKHSGDHTSSSNADASCSVNMDAATKHTESFNFFVLIRAFMIAFVEKQDFASAQSRVNGTMLVNDTYMGNYAKNDSNGDMPVSPTLLAYPANESSMIDSQLQKLDEQVEFDALLDHAAVNTLGKVYTNKISTNIKEPMSIACHPHVGQTNQDGQLSKNELSSKDGSCLMENNDSESLDATAHGDQSEDQNGKFGTWKMIENELENENALQMPSSIFQEEIFRVKPGFIEVHGSVEPNVTIISAGAEAENELNIHIEVIPGIAPMMELDKVASGIPSTIQVNESNTPCDEFVSINAVNELNAVLENHPCVMIAGTSGAQAITLDDQLTSSHVEPGRPSVSHEIQSIQNSQNESEARKENANITTVVRRNSLKVLLAEAKFEDQHVTNAKEHYKSFQDKKIQASEDGRRTTKVWSSKIAFKKPMEPSLKQADHKEWTSSSRLLANKNQEKRAKRKKHWWPFTCCTSFY